VQREVTHHPGKSVAAERHDPREFGKQTEDENDGSSTAPAVAMWCARTVIDRQATAIVAAIRGLVAEQWLDARLAPARRQ
jgi:hypothetical protein